MSNRRGLLVQQPARRSAGGGGSSYGTSSSSASVPLTRLASDADLPAHQPLELPLSDASMHKIAEISNRAGSLRVYDTHLKKSAELLREAVGSINDTLTERKLHLEAMAERRQERGRDEPGNGEKELSEAVERLRGSVVEMTSLIEKGARTTIDRQMELEDEREALRTMAERLHVRQAEDRQRRREYEQARTADSSGRRRKRRRTDGETKRENGGESNEDDDGEADEDAAADASAYLGPPPTSARSLLAEERGVRAAAYDQLSAHQKYGLNNDYIAFKQVWHYGMFPDNDVPLPEASHWFNAAGEPVKYGPNRGEDVKEGGAGAGGDDYDAAGNGGGGEDDDDDLVVQREVISFKCPLSLVTMVDPYRSKVCKHTFERSAILEYLLGGPASLSNKPKMCPQTGCVLEFMASDLTPDTVMRRRIQRAAQLEKRRHDAAATSDIEGDAEEDAQDVDEMSVDASQRRTKAESVARTVKRERFQRSQ
ncbi:hypothetical protein SCUCBS95973_005131 [Sporothrix curviconia]|uniref:peptidylprolyl isomerase n=1 Tax=Sporothrix curviconia TaxID=1260050 RepID=A0ABP0BU82_9PEZI